MLTIVSVECLDGSLLTLPPSSLGPRGIDGEDKRDTCDNKDLFDE